MYIREAPRIVHNLVLLVYLAGFLDTGIAATADTGTLLVCIGSELLLFGNRLLIGTSYSQEAGDCIPLIPIRTNPNYA